MVCCESDKAETSDRSGAIATARRVDDNLRGATGRSVALLARCVALLASCVASDRRKESRKDNDDLLPAVTFPL